MFPNQIINLGTIFPNKKYKVEFPYQDVTAILAMESSCGCSSPVNDVQGKKIIVEYKSGAFPIHLEQRGETKVSIDKVIKVKYSSPPAGVITGVHLHIKGVLILT